MRFRPIRVIGLLGVFGLAIVGCSGGSQAQPPGDLPAAVGTAGGSIGVLSRSANRIGGVRRSISGCTGSGSHSFVGGNDGNAAKGADSGVLSGVDNEACESGSSIGGGQSNTVNASGGASYAFIGGGLDNAIGSGYTSFVGGGELNAISFPGSYTVIGGGYKNGVSGQYAAILGGAQNTASGTESTVAGGSGNSAAGFASFAGGYHADAAHGGSFVWSDAVNSAGVKSTGANSFVARATGGVTFYTNAALTTGVTLFSGGGVWSMVSDRAVKTNVTAIDDGTILDKVSSLPISEWSYIDEHGVRHVGPMAQDFYAAFGLGEDSRHITSIDEDGVALAAIKALHRDNDDLKILVKARLSQKDAEIRALQREVAALSARVAAMR